MAGQTRCLELGAPRSTAMYAPQKAETTSTPWLELGPEEEDGTATPSEAVTQSGVGARRHEAC